MAFYPCSNHHAPYRGPAQTAYPAIVEGSESNRRHLRMCQPCFEDYLGSITAKLEEVDFEATDAGGSSIRKLCKFCGATDPPLTVFVTAYPKGEEGRAFYGGCCRSCEPQARAEVLLS